MTAQARNQHFNQLCASYLAKHGAGEAYQKYRIEMARRWLC